MSRRCTSPVSRTSQSLSRLVPAFLLAIVIAGLTFEPSLPVNWRLSADRDSSRSAVTTDSLNVRLSPALDAPIVAVLAAGDRVEVVGEAERGFAPVRHSGGIGWLAVEYLAFGDQAGNGDSAVAPAAGLVDNTVDRLEAQSGPLVGDAETSGLAAPAERWISIDRSDATVSLHDGGTTIAVYSGRIGRDRSVDGFYSTAVGTYHVYSMNKGLAPTPFADDTYLSDWVGFDPVRHNGIHSPVRNADGSIREWQNPTTLGCVRLGAEDAASVFEFAEVGMRVVVRE